ncbi:P27 family phage terminase small subunit [Marinobacter xestospongiae]|uniref:P27 family phage terminase small subunit n=1 Tax=Marinobacter xestospongiae TaxID=994319 RepID=UPI002002F32C|nr:P27 family phage terminase small subunit [Marinobacter xestospongiae]MCK7568800.1 P27 family phage terminase small subunit [Marinobacter xestospongiae]
MKVLQGNFRKDRDSHGPEVEISVPECPKDAPDAVRIAWKKIGPILANQGLLSSCDQIPLFAYLDSYTKFKMVTKAIETLEDMVEATPNGYRQMSQAFHIRNKLWKEVMDAGREFGHTPASRSSLKAPNQGQLDFGGFEDI